MADANNVAKQAPVKKVAKKAVKKTAAKKATAAKTAPTEKSITRVNVNIGDDVERVEPVASTASPEPTPVVESNPVEQVDVEKVDVEVTQTETDAPQTEVKSDEPETVALTVESEPEERTVEVDRPKFTKGNVVARRTDRRARNRNIRRSEPLA